MNKTTHEIVMDYAYQNQKAMLMIHNAVTDYAAARCLLLNGLFPGLVLGAQAVEKYLKGSILFIDTNKNTRNLSHKLIELKNELQELSQISLEQFVPFLERLEKHYLTRYPDNKDKSTSMSTGELHELDELIIYLNENLAIPEEVKFRSGLYVEMLDTRLTNGEWLVISNEAFEKIQDRLASKYRDIEMRMYPSIE